MAAIKIFSRQKERRQKLPCESMKYAYSIQHQTPEAPFTPSLAKCKDFEIVGRALPTLHYKKLSLTDNSGFLSNPLLTHSHQLR